jgi:type VI secretion system secreted protein Hcp
MDSRAKQVVAVAAVAAGLAATAPAMADDAFLNIPGVQGDSLDGKHTNEIDVLSWSWGPTGGSGGTVLRNLTITKRVDKASPAIGAAFTGDGHGGIGTKGPITLTVRRNIAGDSGLKGSTGSIPNGTEYIKLQIKDAKVVSVKLGQSTSDGRVTEEVVFTFSQVAYTFTGANGTQTSNITGTPFSYDLKSNAGI